MDSAQILLIDGTDPIAPKTSIKNSQMPSRQVCINFLIEGATPNIPYQVRVSLKNQDENIREIGYSAPQGADAQMKVVFNLSFLIDYYFEKEQYLVIDIAKGPFQSSFTYLLAVLLTSQNSTIIDQVTKENQNELIHIIANEIKFSNKFIEFKCNIENPVEPLFYVIKKSKQTQNQVNKEFIAIYKSEISPNGQFMPLVIRSHYIDYNEHDRSIVIELYNAYNNFIGKRETTINSILKAVMTSITIGEAKAFVQANEFEKQQKSFTQLLKMKLNFNLMIGIDFTGSNGHYKDKGTLHFLCKDKLNLYQSAIKQCGKILSAYDSDKIYPVYGFGAICPGEKSVSHIFPLNLNPNGDPNIKGISGVLQTYSKTVPNLTFAGPTLFGPLLNQFFSMIASIPKQEFSYNIILILTDGMIDDMDQTIELLVAACDLPVSVVIVGVGDADFKNMRILDCDNGFLTSKSGKRSKRDIVQFVEYNKAGNDAKKLSELVLEELPSQVEMFYNDK